MLAFEFASTPDAIPCQTAETIEWTQKAISCSSEVNVRFTPGPELNAILSAQEDFLQVAVQEAVQWILEVELEECLRRRL